MSHAHYLRVLGAVFAATMLGVIGFNVAVDPYGFFGSPRIVGFNAVKPKAGGQSHAAKAYQVARAAPTTVIIGNSRPEMGLDPRSACWRPEDRPVFNLGLRGAGFRMQADYLRHAVAGGTVRHAVIGLDFSEFVVDANERPTDSATRAGASETGSRRRLTSIGSALPLPPRNI